MGFVGFHLPSSRKSSFSVCRILVAFGLWGKNMTNDLQDLMNCTICSVNSPELDIVRALQITKFNLFAKHSRCLIFKSCAAAFIFAALSVTIQDTVPRMLNSSKTSSIIFAIVSAFSSISTNLISRAEEISSG